MKRLVITLACAALMPFSASCSSAQKSTMEDEDQPSLSWRLSQRSGGSGWVSLKFYSDDGGKTVGYEVDRVDANGVFFAESGTPSSEEFDELRRLTSNSVIEQLKGNLRPLSETQAQSQMVVGDLSLVSTMMECSPLPECATRFEGEIKLQPANDAATALQHFLHAFVGRHPGTKATILSHGTSTVP